MATLYSGELDFPGARSIAKLTRRFTNKATGKITATETVGFICSLVEPDPNTILAVVRKHWTIENSFFHTRDVAYREDQQTMHSRHGPLNMALLRSTAISIANLTGKTNRKDSVAAFNRNPNSFLLTFKVSNPLDTS